MFGGGIANMNCTCFSQEIQVRMLLSLKRPVRKISPADNQMLSPGETVLIFKQTSAGYKYPDFFSDSFPLRFLGSSDECDPPVHVQYMAGRRIMTYWVHWEDLRFFEK